MRSWGYGLPGLRVQSWAGGRVHTGPGSSLSLPLLQDSGLSGGEPPEKERRRLKESFENYRRWARVGAGRGAVRAGSPARTPHT